ncbi:hypothetical protein HYS50_03350 [Candidatus Woesearchaeota archaeon]|nr:hypothetical protein [Candidatus Woesearchaeota archaeon]
MDELSVTAVDPNLVNTLISIFGSVLISLFKSESWSKETKQKISIAVSVLVGVGVALYTDKKAVSDFVAFSGMSVGIMQAFYLGVWEKIGAEGITRTARSRTIDAVKLLVTGNAATSVHPAAAAAATTTNSAPISSVPIEQEEDLLLPAVVKAVNEVNAMLHDWKAGLISDADAVERMNGIRTRWGSVLPPFPAGYPL